MLLQAESRVCFVYVAGGLIIGLGALLIPSSLKRHPLTASSHVLCLAVLMWHLACYTATAVAAVAAAPKLAMSIGLLTFTQGSPAVLQLLAQVVTAMTLAALCRADLISNDPDHDNPAAPTAVEVSGPVTSLHDSIANYWHHGSAQAEPSYQTTAAAAASCSAGGDSAAESSALSVSDSGLTPIRSRVGQATPANRPPASLVCALNLWHCAPKSPPPTHWLLLKPVSYCALLSVTMTLTASFCLSRCLSRHLLQCRLWRLLWCITLSGNRAFRNVCFACMELSSLVIAYIRLLSLLSGKSRSVRLHHLLVCLP